MARCPKCNERISYGKIISRFGKLITCDKCGSKLGFGKQPLLVSVVLGFFFELILYASGRIDDIFLQIVLILAIYITSISISSKFIKLEHVANPQLYKYQRDLKNLSAILIGFLILVLLLGVFMYMSLFVMGDAFWRNTGIGAAVIFSILMVAMVYWIFKREKLKKLIEREKEEIRLRDILKG